mgnify:CR=1 FL=1
MKLSLKSTLIGTGASLLASTAMAQNLTLQSAFPFSLEVIDTSIHRFVEDVATATNGELTFTPYDAGSFSPPFEILENVGNGSLDAGWSAASYWAGQIPAAALFQSIPFGPDVPKYLSWLYGGGGLELWEALYAPHNVVPIPWECRRFPFLLARRFSGLIRGALVPLNSVFPPLIPVRASLKLPSTTTSLAGISPAASINCWLTLTYGPDWQKASAWPCEMPAVI